MKKVLVLVGTRPNFIKVTQIKKVAENLGGLDVKVVHTGQHYDDKMSGIFFRQFEMEPDFFLNIPKGISPNGQIAHIIIELDRIMREVFVPDILLVVGDVNSTLAGAIVANKLGIPLAHVESGLRSNDRGMPEEINRILTDEITDFYFVTEESGIKNLEAEGCDMDKVFFVGNTMIDTLVAFNEKIDASNIFESIEGKPGHYALMTMHRPATVDNKKGLNDLLETIQVIVQNSPVIFPIHPRTRNNFEKHGLMDELQSISGLTLCPPVGYFEFQKLIKDSKFVITDSGGIQEETTFRQVPCITLRPNTERPCTIDEGTNTLAPFDVKIIAGLIEQIENGTYKKGDIPKYWDGGTTKRILNILLQKL